MTNKAETAVSKFSGGYNCAQSVLYAFCDDLHLDKELALKIACGFGAGMGRNEEVCGAVTGGIMVLGLKYGRGENDDRAVTEQTYRKIRYLMEEFAKKNGSCICRQLLGSCDLTTDEGKKQFQENDLMNRVCKPCVKSAVEIVGSIIESGS
ncbi:MAG: C_GCAxxG_C_C family protein [Anaerolineae bacterium]|nr:C_GCAxxG_C_C family protein [Anaerolineae bacterium]